MPQDKEPSVALCAKCAIFLSPLRRITGLLQSQQTNGPGSKCTQLLARTTFCVVVLNAQDDDRADVDDGEYDEDEEEEEEDETVKEEENAVCGLS